MLKIKQIEGKKATWLLYGLFGVIILLKELASHWFLYHNLKTTALWEEPTGFWMIWAPKICVSAFLAFFVLLSKRKWWTLLVLIVIDLWNISNLLYFKANQYFLTWDVIMIADNLSGFESSIGFYWNWKWIVFPLLTLLYSLILPFIKPTSISCKGILLPTLLIVIGLWGGRYSMIECYRLGHKSEYYIPFTTPPHFQFNEAEFYVQHHSITAHLLGIIVHKTINTLSSANISLSDKEMQQYYSPSSGSKEITPSHNLLILFIESFESFALEMKDRDGNYLLPNLHNLTESQGVLYAHKIKSQVAHGVSIDGQMICNTGLLPIKNGIAAMKYGGNTYPNYAHFYEKSILVNPYSATTWNQNIVTYSYGYKKMICKKHKDETMNDAEIFETLNSIFDKDSIGCYFVMTLDSHTPFNRVPRDTTLHFDSTVSKKVQDYINCLHHTDSCFGAWYNEWSKTEQAKNTVLVITGDHTVFKDENGYCPLIIQSPDIQGNIKIEEACYQMDIYPTIMHLIGAENYPWKGFGVNLLDSAACHNRPITEERAYELSDKIIRSDYFKE